MIIFFHKNIKDHRWAVLVYWPSDDPLPGHKILPQCSLIIPLIKDLEPRGHRMNIITTAIRPPAMCLQEHVLKVHRWWRRLSRNALIINWERFSAMLEGNKFEQEGWGGFYRTHWRPRKGRHFKHLTLNQIYDLFCSDLYFFTLIFRPRNEDVLGLSVRLHFCAVINHRLLFFSARYNTVLFKTENSWKSTTDVSYFLYRAWYKNVN